MPPNNPMTEGEALAVDYSTLARDVARTLQKAGAPLTEDQILLLAGSLAVYVESALAAHTAASGGEVVAWQERYLDTDTGEWSQWRYCAKYIYEAHLNFRVPEIEARALYTAPPSAPVGVPVAQVRRGGKGAPHDALYAGLIPRGPATPEVKEGDLLYLAQQPAQAAPGWKLVPVVATPEMLEAATGLFKSVGLYGCYNAMLAAAPTPPGDDAAGGA